VFALDYPGFGLSEGLHGFIPSFDTLVDDVAEHFTKVKGMLPLNHFWFLTLPFFFYLFFLEQLISVNIFSASSNVHVFFYEISLNEIQMPNLDTTYQLI
jgi:hypothetical protein